ncbi:MAG: bifunctional phosphoglucose/phosphomannose isomerase [Ignavibacterium sp.]|nr:MAG: bifunctional phosphoglucose/phosphomannose isomerase [Ignavibacterium sp.]
MNIENLKKVHDSNNQFQVLVDSYQQIENAWAAETNLTNEISSEIKNIIVAGMGGSAISADLLSSFLSDELNMPFNSCRDYSLSKYADNNSLIIASSYSGNTEETISCFKDALKRGCKIIAVSTGGELKDLALENNISWISLQKGFQPRFALGASFFTMLKILQTLKLIPAQDKIVNEIISLWKQKGNEYSSDKNQAIATAEKLIGFIPIIYSSNKLEAVGYRLKCQFNENSKLHAFSAVIPELNHNEIVGWETFSEKQFNAKLIAILDDDNHPQIQKRFDITHDLTQRSKVEVITFRSSEKKLKVRIMDLIYLGDWITYYLSILRGFDPSEIDYIMELKQSLA